jgi:dolichol-phosphate mannosyltransferase|tara:strand:+ start:501 stop:1211 length:711 start_codon:yes stop_codon:yes gene_type:complete
MKTIIIIPTLNERKNIISLIKKIIKINNKFDLLFVDDNSKDGTRDEIISINKKNKKIKFIFRKKKYGVGSAHKEGLTYAYKNKYNIAITMDGDGTHNPKYIPQLIKNLKNYPIIITNRFLSVNSLRDWPLYRKFLTMIRYYLINFMLNISYDTSGAYRCYDLKKVKIKDILLAKDNGYSFFWESTYILHIKNYKINEIPVDLPFRKLGSSKMQFKDIFSALFYLFVYSIKKRLLHI